jgi:hypothetical protein
MTLALCWFRMHEYTKYTRTSDFECMCQQHHRYQTCVQQFIDRFIEEHSSSLAIPDSSAGFRKEAVAAMVEAVEATAIKAKATIDVVFKYPQQIVAQFVQEVMKTVHNRFIKVRRGTWCSVWVWVGGWVATRPCLAPFCYSSQPLISPSPHHISVIICLACQGGSVTQRRVSRPPARDVRPMQGPARAAHEEPPSVGPVRPLSRVAASQAV